MLDSIKEYTKVLKAIRKEKKITQKDFADKVETPQSYLSKIESGKVNIGLSSFIEMARLLDHEVILVPRSEVTLVKSLVSTYDNTRKAKGTTPAYSLENTDDDDNDL